MPDVARFREPPRGRQHRRRALQTTATTCESTPRSDPHRTQNPCENFVRWLTPETRLDRRARRSSTNDFEDESAGELGVQSDDGDDDLSYLSSDDAAYPADSALA